MSQDTWIVTPLGTGAAAPTATRSTSAYLVDDGQQAILLDAGDGVARQLAIQGAVSRVRAICISHAHVDHWSGLPALLRARDLLQQAPLPLYVPQPEVTRIRTVLEQFEVEAAAQIHGLRPGDEAQLPLGGRLRVAHAEHRVPALAWRLEARPPVARLREPFLAQLGALADPRHRGPVMQQLRRGESVELGGRRWTPADAWEPAPAHGAIVVYSGDTQPCASVRQLAQGADLLIHEATYANAQQEAAVLWGHSTAREAGQVAADARVGQLLLTHLSARHGPDDEATLVAQARAVYPGPVAIATEGAALTIPPAVRAPVPGREGGRSPIVSACSHAP